MDTCHLYWSESGSEPPGAMWRHSHMMWSRPMPACAPWVYLLSIPWGIWFIFVSYILVYLRRRQIQMFIKINNPIKLVKFNPTLDWVSRILVNVGPGIMVAEKNERYLKILFMISWYTLCLRLLPSCVCQSRCRALSCSRSGDHILFVKHSELFTGILRYLSLVGVRPSFGICQ